MARSIDQLVQDVSTGRGTAREIRAAARLMSLLEEEPQRLPELFRASPLNNWPQPRLILGITGAPGSGKSTLTDQLIASYRERFPDKRLGVIAVDPSSPFTGGAVLGDRVRMMRHATDPQIFIRSMASRGHLGGLSLGVKSVLRVMGLIGCDTVFIETVGVGQSEVEVAGVADLVMIVLAPGQGDSIQMLKAGLMEIGDLFVINKSDKEGANQLYSTLLNALTIGQPLAVPDHHDLLDHNGNTPVDPVDVELEDAVLARRRPETPSVYLVSASEQVGIEELVDGLEEKAQRLNTHWFERRDAAVSDEVRESVFEEARRRIARVLDAQENGKHNIDKVLQGQMSVAELASILLAETVRNHS